MQRPRPDSVNLGLRSAGYRGYADHMRTDEFRRGLERLEALAAAGATAFMCAEAEPVAVPPRGCSRTRCSCAAGGSCTS